MNILKGLIRKSTMRKLAGTIDYDPVKFRRVQTIISTIRENAKLFGAVEIDTPILESKKFLLNKYGEEAENKLIYQIWEPDQIKEEEKVPTRPKTALRYDLTVPFTRYLMNNGIEKMRRLQVGKVFRRDRPYPESGRFTEFYQADYDIIGCRPEMASEGEIFKLITNVMDDLQFKNYRIEFNFRENLEKIVEIAEIPSELFKSVCTSIDKLDKQPWEDVSQELLRKSISQKSIIKLKELLDKNYLDPSLDETYFKLSEYLQIFGVEERLKFNASLARGLDYYTGMIYEVVRIQSPNSSATSCMGVGTLIAGGRYDRLIYKTKKGQKKYIPAIGVSFGINRMEMVIAELPKEKEFKILIVADESKIKKKIEIQNLLYRNGIQAQYLDGNESRCNQIIRGIKMNFNYVLIYGEDEEMIKVKRNDQSPDRLSTIEDLIDTIYDFERTCKR